MRGRCLVGIGPAGTNPWEGGDDRPGGELRVFPNALVKF